MKILAVSDFHGVPDASEHLKRFLRRDHDCLVIAGDFTELGPLSAAEDILEKIEELGVRTLAVPGNCDPKPILELLERHGVNLHGKLVWINDLAFVGLGGSNLTPFNTPFELQEAEIEEELLKLSKRAGERWVLVTHAPPFNTELDVVRSGVHVGSKGVRRVIEQKRPLLAICGHMHESRNVGRIGRTVVVNPGPISKRYAAEIEVEGEGVQAKLLG